MSELEQPEYDKIRDYLTNLGLFEEGMNISDMVDLSAAIRNSNHSAREEEKLRETAKDSDKIDIEYHENPKIMERKYTNALDRRMPWSLFPTPEQLSKEQKTRVLIAYKEQINICRYHRAKSSSIFTEWNCVYNIPISKHRNIQNIKEGVHHTRSGRTLKSAPHYVDDGSDSESSVIRKSKKKIRKLSNDEIIARSSLFRDIVPTHTNILQEAAPKFNVQSNNKSIKELHPSEKQDTCRILENIDLRGEYKNDIMKFRPSVFCPDVTASKMTVVAQVHRDSSVSGLSLLCDTRQDTEDDTTMSPRKKSKRLKFASQEE